VSFVDVGRHSSWCPSVAAALSMLDAIAVASVLVIAAVVAAVVAVVAVVVDDNNSC
jgi:hypothetical protein